MQEEGNRSKDNAASNWTRLMPHRRALLLATLAASIGGVRANAEALSDEALGGILAERIDVGGRSTGIVACRQRRRREPAVHLWATGHT